MQTKKEAVLVIILSETRAHEHTFDLFNKNMLQVLKADLALCVANNDREDPDNPFYRHAKYVWKFDEPKDWGHAFDSIAQKQGIRTDWRQLIQIKDQWLGGIKGPGAHTGSGGIMLFFRLFLKQCLAASDLLERYDRFVVTRSDFVYHIPHIPLENLDPKYIWIPNGEDYGGYTDRHIVASREEIMNVLSISDPIISAPEALYEEMSAYTEWNLEQFIRFSFKRLGLSSKVRRFPYTMYTVRPKDGHTSWSKGVFDSRHNYYIKYPNEYKRHRIASWFIKKHGDWNPLTIGLFNFLNVLFNFQREMKFKIKTNLGLSDVETHG